MSVQLESKSAGIQACPLVKLLWSSLILKHGNTMSCLFIFPWDGRTKTNGSSQSAALWGRLPCYKMRHTT